MKHNNRTPRKRFKLLGNSIELRETRKEELETILKEAKQVTRSAVMGLVGSTLISQLSTKLGYAEHHAHGKTMASDKKVVYATCKHNSKHYCIVYVSQMEYIFREV